MILRDPVPQRMMKTYGIVRPPDHFRPATCAEVDCEAYTHGWVSTMLAGSDDLAFLTQRVCRGDVDGWHRHFTTELAPDGFVRLTFPPGQPCFRVSSHRVSVERPPIFLVRPGDARSNPRDRSGRPFGDPVTSVRLAQAQGRIHTRPEHWVEDSAETLDRVRSAREKG